MKGSTKAGQHQWPAAAAYLGRRHVRNQLLPPGGESANTSCGLHNAQVGFAIYGPVCQTNGMIILRLLSLGLVLLAAPTASFAQEATCQQLFPGGQPPALVNARLAPRTTLLCNDAYAVLASGLTHGPLWSAEHPTAASLAAARDTAREGTFHPDDRLPRADQAQLRDYRSSGYDRGHMTPSGDMPDAQAQQQSFSLANIVPQIGVLNRGIWERIESAVRDLAVREGELYVVTGPAFEGEQIDAIGPSGVLVPTSTWKAVYDPQVRGTAVYLCRNTSKPTCSIISVVALSRTVGVDPFPGLTNDVKQTAMVLPSPNLSHRRSAASQRYRRGTGQ
jgi:endonuclease G